MTLHSRADVGRTRPHVLFFTLLATCLSVAACSVEPAPDGAGVAEDGGPSGASVGLDSWAEGPARSAIESFVAGVSTPGSASFVPAAERIAVFDNDGTLWAVQPLYFQLAFALDRVRAVAAGRPKLADDELVQAILDDDRERIAGMSHADIFEVIALSHGGVTVSEFRSIVRDWLATARHPRFDRPYHELLYQPQLELLDYLRAHDFKVFIVSGGGVDFMRVFAEEAYGIPSEHVIGSSATATFDETGPSIIKGSEVSSLNDGPGKPVNINLHIGRRPILAFGNSDGDLQMLQYTDDGEGPALVLILRHDDETREWAYDRDSSIGRLDVALDVAADRGWTVVSMRNDFARVFASSE